ncbi:hypothetical protein GPA22_19155 [Aromatoleum toluvorans]|uniref:Peptidase MA superfamily protein n=1 Tax=Aromatoleum toluvorans TaxID=92002 RepID=A0ABX1Q299_9RHOO|nr:hypothetical protein [Aromatoleum toluvorans]NMG45839.1 hypothetical protein [Aromatoleum toluvorans]
MFARCLLVLGALFAAVPNARAWEPGAISGLSGLTIRVEGEGWGSAERDEIETLLYAVADELTRGATAAPVDPIVVTHAPGSPVTLFDKGSQGEYRVRLSARNRGWAQYAYQFGHELCHILSNYERRAHDAGRRETQWFEEALCETAGLYVLRSMAQRWRTDAPYPGWDVYAPSLAAYADRLAAEPHRQLPSGMSIAAWLESKLPRLSADPYRRSDNEVVANLLLPQFEQGPGRWVVLRYLNLAPAAPGGLAGYLVQWRNSAPAEHRGFIDALAGSLGLHQAAVAAL